ncbi:MAG: S-methyl-5-thioribose-1-phosphate isomerase [Planctomycetes bacterium]|nr:S-methyl-5-thioribose-1-phosphate isomerase [Planctomycetota bacterium]
MPRTLEWEGGEDGTLFVLDQTRLPGTLAVVPLADLAAVHDAIRRLVVRGAPAIGVAAAYGVVVGVREAGPGSLEGVCRTLAAARPTAVNLGWAVERMRRAGAGLPAGASHKALVARLLEEARRVHAEDLAMCEAIGRHGAALLPEEGTVLTHCNAGALATSDHGTALAVVYAARRAGKRIAVYADETRPLLQGARLTAWECMQRGVPVTLICDGAVGTVLGQGRVDCVVVGADRIAANGDVANKVGTYTVSVLAREHRVPFYVAAPSSTFDLGCPDGDHIPIEERDPREVTHPLGQRAAPDGVRVYNPAFDVTPASHVTAIVTERGVLHRPDREGIRRHLA